MIGRVSWRTRIPAANGWGRFPGRRYWQPATRCRLWLSECLRLPYVIRLRLAERAVVAKGRLMELPFAFSALKDFCRPGLEFIWFVNPGQHFACWAYYLLGFQPCESALISVNQQ